jgi:hypothetical protein
LVPISRPPDASFAGAAVAPRGNRATAVLAFIQFPRMDQAVRAGQRDTDSSSTVQGGFDCAGPMPAPAGLDRTPVGRIFRKPFRRSFREKTCHLAAMQARYRSIRKSGPNGAAFCGG